jgi:hypothetical protein
MGVSAHASESTCLAVAIEENEIKRENKGHIILILELVSSWDFNYCLS